MLSKTLAGGLTALALAAGAPAAAHADAPSCDHYAWTSPPKVVIHTGEFAGGETRKANMIQAIEDVNAEFNMVGATSAQVVSTELSTDPFTLTTLYDASTPTIHVGFVPSLAGENAVAATKPYHFTGTCNMARANIGVLDLNAFDWRFNMPEDAGESYWEAGAKDGDGNKYFRTSYLHELLHAFGLDHNATQYAFMNYAARPWANRPDEDRVRPLPADIRLLRSWYPGSGVRTEIATLTTWFDPDQLSNGAATGKVLCAPSLGSDFSASLFDAHCGSGGARSGSTDVCTGDTLRTRFTLANYSTHAVDLDVRLWLSADAEWDPFDAVSPTRPDVISVDEATSARKGVSFEVPDVPSGEYHMILRATGGGADWIPLPGTVTAC